MRLNAAPSRPWRAGWPGLMADHPRCCTVTRVPVSVGSKRTSTSVLSSAAKLALRQVKTRRDGGCHTVTRPASWTWVPAFLCEDLERDGRLHGDADRDRRLVTC